LLIGNLLAVGWRSTEGCMVEASGETGRA